MKVNTKIARARQRPTAQLDVALMRGPRGSGAHQNYGIQRSIVDRASGSCRSKRMAHPVAALNRRSDPVTASWYISGMTRAIVSVPKELFANGERLAEQLGIARSELYARALEEYVRRHGSDDVTALLDAVYASEGSAIDPVISDLQEAALAERDSP